MNHWQRNDWEEGRGIMGKIIEYCRKDVLCQAIFQLGENDNKEIARRKLMRYTNLTAAQLRDAIKDNIRHLCELSTTRKDNVVPYTFYQLIEFRAFRERVRGKDDIPERVKNLIPEEEEEIDVDAIRERSSRNLEQRRNGIIEKSRVYASKMNGIPLKVQEVDMRLLPNIELNISDVEYGILSIGDHDNTTVMSHKFSIFYYARLNIMKLKSVFNNTKPIAPDDDLFKNIAAEQKSQNWECGDCLTPNTAAQSKCGCCQASNPNSTTMPSNSQPAVKDDKPNAVSSATSFSFGSFGSALIANNNNNSLFQSKYDKQLKLTSPADPKPSSVFGTSSSFSSLTSINNTRKKPATQLPATKHTAKKFKQDDNQQKIDSMYDSLKETLHKY